MRFLAACAVLSVAVSGAQRCSAENVTLAAHVVLRGEHSLLSIAAGTPVEFISSDGHGIKVRYAGQVGTIPVDSVEGPLPDEPKPTPTPVPTPEKPPVTPAIVFGLTTFFLAESSDAPNEWREYVPEGERPDQWLHMASARVIVDAVDPEAYLRDLGAAGVAANPRSTSRFVPFDGPKILETITFAPPGSEVNYEQWTLSRAVYSEGTGLTLYQYAMRFYMYGDATRNLIEAERLHMLYSFSTAPFTEVKDILMRHNLGVRLHTEPVVKGDFRFGLFSFVPKFSVDLFGYTENEAHIPALEDTNGTLWSEAPSRSYMFDSEGKGVPVIGFDWCSTTPPAQLKSANKSVNVAGVYTVHLGCWSGPRFRIDRPGTYRMKLIFELKDQKGFVMQAAATREIQVVDGASPEAASH